MLKVWISEIMCNKFNVDKICIEVTSYSQKNDDYDETYAQFSSVRTFDMTTVLSYDWLHTGSAH